MVSRNPQTGDLRDSSLPVEMHADRWEHRRVTDYVYDMSDPERDALTEQFLSTKRLGCDRFACFALEGTDPFANIARQLEREVFEHSWGNDSATMKKEYGPYDESSVFFMVVDTHDKVPAGVAADDPQLPGRTQDDRRPRRLPSSPPSRRRAIPVADVMRHHGIDDLDRCWDGATAAIPRQYRRRLAATHVQLMRIMAMAAMRENIQHFVAVLDAPVVRAGARRPRTAADAAGRHAAVHAHGRPEQPGGLRPRAVAAGTRRATQSQGGTEDSGTASPRRPCPARNSSPRR